MKIRTDFVTNSSSSSFILGFASEDTVRDEVKSGLEGRDLYFLERICDDVQSADRMSKEEVIQVVREHLEDTVGYSVLSRHFYGWFTPDAMEYMETPEFKAECEEAIRDKLSEIEKKLKDKGVLVDLTYGDHTRDGSILEHEIMVGHPAVIVAMSNH